MPFKISKRNVFIFSEGSTSFRVRNPRFDSHRPTNQSLSSIDNSITSNDNNNVAPVSSTGECKSILYLKLSKFIRRITS